MWRLQHLPGPPASFVLLRLHVFPAMFSRHNPYNSRAHKPGAGTRNGAAALFAAIMTFLIDTGCYSTVVAWLPVTAWHLHIIFLNSVFLVSEASLNLQIFALRDVSQHFDSEELGRVARLRPWSQQF